MNALQAYEQRLLQKMNGNSAVQPIWTTLIPVLLEILIPLLGNCFGQARGNRDRMIDALRNPNILQRAMLRRAFSNSRDIRELVPGFWDRNKLQEAVIDAARDTPENELEELVTLAEENNPYFL